MSQPKVFVVSDTHFYHANIIKYCNRPYSDVIQMNKDIVKKWNSIVGKEDIVYHLGDFLLGKKDYIPLIAGTLHGRIKLILGNHDHSSPKHYLEYGFKEVYNKPVVLLQYDVILSHAPIENIEKYGCLKNIHGHVHNSLNINVTPQYYNASIEVIKYRPVLIEDAILAMKEAENNGTCNSDRHPIQNT